MRVAVIIVSLVLLARTGFSQKQGGYDEVPVFVSVQGVGSIEIPAVISDEEIYLPVTVLFDFLKIRNTNSVSLDSVSGFFINEEARFLIDKSHNRINYNQKTFAVSPEDFIKTETNLYLKADYFGQVFGLNTRFSFRSLSVSINTALELPVISEMRRTLMHNNINALKGEVKADTTIGRNYPIFHFGMADWSVINTQQQGQPNDMRVGLLLGGAIGGGETTVGLNYNNTTHFSKKQQYYLWRYADNNHAALRQVMMGKIPEHPTASIFDPIVGIQLTNTPTSFRRSFGTYRISNHTTPGYTVELYVNNVLVDYVKADPAGYYSFQVPLVYGNSVVKLRFYGPWGEQRSTEENISIPFNFLPANELEYKVSGGVVEDSLRSRFARAIVNYGFFPNLTVGGGAEYLSTVNAGRAMPFLNTSLRIGPGLLLSNEYNYGIRNKTVISYRRPSDLSIEFNYTTYQKGQTAINVTYKEERKAVLCVPIRTKKIALFSRLTVDQFIIPSYKNLTSKYTTAEWLLTGNVLGVGTSVNTYSLFLTGSDPYLYSNLALTFRLPGNILFTPQAQYEYKARDLMSVKYEIEKGFLGHGYLNMMYERNFKSRFTSISVGLRYDFSFGQFGVTHRHANKVNTRIATARGSLLYDRKTNYIATSNRPAVGRGGIVIMPYLDINGNGRRDMDEPDAPGLKLKVNSGIIKRKEKENSIRITDLEPYTNCRIEMDRNSFDNIAWKITKPVLSVVVDPNDFKMIEVPVAVMGEVSGTVYLRDTTGHQKGLGQIIVCIYNKHSDLVARVLTESDGYFNYLGLPPGKYKAQVDKEQLHKLHMNALPISIPVIITANKEGDVIEGLEFVLENRRRP